MVKPATWHLSVRPLPQQDDPNGSRRLRALAKAMLRRYGIRLVSLGQIKAEPAEIASVPPQCPIVASAKEPA